VSLSCEIGINSYLINVTEMDLTWLAVLITSKFTLSWLFS